MPTTRFLPGDRVQVKPPSAAVLGLAANATHTIAHVDDFGQIAIRGGSSYYHPSHFELVERAAPDETYCLKDCEGDWHVSTESAEDGFRMITPYGPSVLTRSVERLVDTYGIDAEPLPSEPDETYCLKDETGDWWVSDGTDHFLVPPRGTYPTKVAPEERAVHYGIDAEPLPAMKGYEPTHAEVDEVPAPLKKGDAVLVWATVGEPDPDDDGDIQLGTPTGDGRNDWFHARPDAIVRPAEGQVPPWVKPTAVDLLARVEARVEEWERTTADSTETWSGLAMRMCAAEIRAALKEG